MARSLRSSVMFIAAVIVSMMSITVYTIAGINLIVHHRDYATSTLVCAVAGGIAMLSLMTLVSLPPPK